MSHFIPLKVKFELKSTRQPRLVLSRVFQCDREESHTCIKCEPGERFVNVEEKVLIHRVSDWIQCQRGSRSTCPALWGTTVNTQQLGAAAEQSEYPPRAEIVWRRSGV